MESNQETKKEYSQCITNQKIASKWQLQLAIFIDRKFDWWKSQKNQNTK